MASVVHPGRHCISFGVLKPGHCECGIDRQVRIATVVMEIRSLNPPKPHLHGHDLPAGFAHHLRNLGPHSLHIGRIRRHVSERGRYRAGVGVSCRDQHPVSGNPAKLRDGATDVTRALPIEAHDIHDHKGYRDIAGHANGGPCPQRPVSVTGRFVPAGVARHQQACRRRHVPFAGPQLQPVIAQSHRCLPELPIVCVTRPSSIRTAGNARPSSQADCRQPEQVCCACPHTA